MTHLANDGVIPQVFVATVAASSATIVAPTETQTEARSGSTQAPRGAGVPTPSLKEEVDSNGSVVDPPEGFDTALGCADHLVIATRGSNEDRGLGGPGSAFVRSYAAAVSQYRPGDTIAVQANPYPAVPVQPWLIDYLDSYRDSVASGIDWLASVVIQQGLRCPEQKLVVVGYSQGAEVTGDVLNAMSGTALEGIAGAVLWGDPRFNPDDLAAYGGFVYNRKGIYRARSQYEYSGQVMSFCHDGDPICQLRSTVTGLPTPFTNEPALDFLFPLLTPDFDLYPEFVRLPQHTDYENDVTALDFPATRIVRFPWPT